MSSFYSDASLIVIPSGYKASKVYSAVPTDGSGDLTFTRSNDTATRVNSAGLIEKVRTNVLLQSNTFSTTWTNVNTTETSGQAGYDGTNNAWLLDKSAGSGYINQTISLSGVQTFSVYAKAGTDNWMVLLITGFSAYYDLQNGVLGTVAAGATTTITSVGSGWYRCTISASATTTGVRIYPAEGNNDTSGTSGNILIQSAQLETGDIATPYIGPTTTAAVSVGPVANVPRLDYLNSTCPKLLLEPQRTNLVTFSEQFGNAAWTKDGITITANATTSPDGYANADKLVASAAAGDKIAYQVLTVTNSVAYTSSAYFKASEYNYAFFRLGGIDGNPYVIYNLATQAVVSTSGLITSTITSVGNGWYRVTVTATQTSTTLAPVLMFLPTTGYTLSGSNIPQFTGNGTSGGFVWGVQSELGAYATSYIPTLAASVTRGADACSKTGISSLIGQTEGTIFIDLIWNNSIADVVPFDITGSDGKLIWMRGIGAQFYGNGTTLLADIGRPGAVQGTRYKIAFVYGQNDFRLYRNGSLIGTDTSGTFTGTFSDIALNSVINQSNLFNQVLLFKTRLDNATLASLTTL